jgi:glucan phosphoethanolaminetransferase (alkaline phosphatase superfamily)
MNLIHSEMGRLLLFILITLVQMLLALFLLFYGSESLKPFAIFLLIVQLFAIRKIYVYLSHMFRYRRA